MKVNSKQLEIYKRLEIDLKDLKPYYLIQANRLLKALNQYSDTYATNLKEVLNNYIKEPTRDLIDVIEEVENKEHYNSFAINDTLFDIYYKDEELIKETLKE